MQTRKFPMTDAHLQCKNTDKNPHIRTINYFYTAQTPLTAIGLPKSTTAIATKQEYSEPKTIVGCAFHGASPDML